jgi:hypothetical protein
MARNRSNRPTYRCGGYASYTGHCGALDCETCHPGGARELELQEILGPVIARRDELQAKIDELDAKGEDVPESLITELDQIEGEIARAENDEGGDDYDGPDDDDCDDYLADRAADRYADEYFNRE